MAKMTGRNVNVSDTATVTGPINVGAVTSVVIAAANPERIGLSVNSGDSIKPVWIKLQPATTDNDLKGIFLSERGLGLNRWDMPTDNPYTGEICAISDSSTNEVYVTEW